MASSDDEVDTVPQSVENYYFVDENEEVVSFSDLPIQWTENKDATADGNNDSTGKRLQEMIFLRGAADNGLQKIYKPVKAWRFDLSGSKLEIFVLTKENVWIKLLKPRKSYEEIIRTVLVTLQCLHYARKHPETSAKSLWDSLSRVFRSFEEAPSQNDLVEHVGFIGEAVERDDLLSKCEFLLTFLKNPAKQMINEENVQGSAVSGFIVDDADGDAYHPENDDDFFMSGFMVDDADDAMEDAQDNSNNDSDDDLFDSVCAFCDNGGNLLCCEGRCMRSFHASKAAGSESLCESLGLTAREVEAMKNFECENCKQKQHQCFACGKLGSSDRSFGAEVFKCASATCGYFYHPQCVAELLHPKDKVAAEKLHKKIIEGESVMCPIHRCCICKQLENKKELDLQLAVCRRCPTSYHRKCLPREIAFEDDEEFEQRAWERLLPGRILIYCLKHEIDEEIGTPIRDHIIFPGVKGKMGTVKQKSRKWSPDLPASNEAVLLKKRKLPLEGSLTGKTVAKSTKESPSGAEKAEISKKDLKGSTASDSLRKASSASGKFSKENTKSFPRKVDRPSAVNSNKKSLGDRLYDLMLQNSEQITTGMKDKADQELVRSELPLLDANSEQRLLTLINEAESSVTLEDVLKRRGVSANMALKNGVDKSITIGKVEGAIEAIKTALKKLEGDCSIEEAKAVCEPELLNQICRWKSKLRVYLAPFLYGPRYTSFGRHFTKVEKLQEIVDILHWYARDGDTIVDFCCGTNDFSYLMNKKLEETGKRCSFKNYDMFQPKNDFNFEERDWFTVLPEELPEGSDLIMGLNPPFGVKATLANKFIDKALEFKPKLLILIVPPETEKLDQKNPPYDLIWENNQCLSGKSFYLPGSVDVYDKQMEQWNVTPPPLYLWSRQDWTAEHRDIAQKHDHLSGQQKMSNFEKNHDETETSRPAMDYHHGNCNASEVIEDVLDAINAEEAGMVVSEGHEEGFVFSDDGKSRGSHGSVKDHRNEISNNKRRHYDEKYGKGASEKSLKDRHNGKKPLTENRHNDKKPLIENRHNDKKPLTENRHKGISRIDRARSQDGTDRRYGMSCNELYPDQIFPNVANSETPYRVSMRDGADGGSYRFYHPEFEMRSDLRPQVPFLGPDTNSFAHRASVGSQGLPYGQMGSLSCVPYGTFSSAAEPAHRMSMSTIDRYAPRLDELNHVRMSGPGPEPPMFRYDTWDPRMSQPEHPGGSIGFASGPYQPIPHQSSAGWLND